MNRTKSSTDSSHRFPLGFTFVINFLGEDNSLQDEHERHVANCCQLLFAGDTDTHTGALYVLALSFGLPPVSWICFLWFIIFQSAPRDQPFHTIPYLTAVIFLLTDRLVGWPKKRVWAKCSDKKKRFCNTENNGFLI